MAIAVTIYVRPNVWGEKRDTYSKSVEVSQSPWNRLSPRPMWSNLNMSSLWRWTSGEESSAGWTWDRVLDGDKECAFMMGE